MVQVTPSAQAIAVLTQPLPDTHVSLVQALPSAHALLEEKPLPLGLQMKKLPPTQEFPLQTTFSQTLALPQNWPGRQSTSLTQPTQTPADLSQTNSHSLLLTQLLGAATQTCLLQMKPPLQSLLSAQSTHAPRLRAQTCPLPLHAASELHLVAGLQTLSMHRFAPLQSLDFKQPTQVKLATSHTPLAQSLLLAQAVGWTQPAITLWLQVPARQASVVQGSPSLQVLGQTGRATSTSSGASVSWTSRTSATSASAVSAISTSAAATSSAALS